MRCWECGEKLDLFDETCPECGERQLGRPSSSDSNSAGESSEAAGTQASPSAGVAGGKKGFPLYAVITAAIVIAAMSAILILFYLWYR